MNSAIFAKNAVLNVSGYSPSQLVFGRMPRIPGAPYNDPPAQEGVTKVEMVEQRLTSLFKAREAFSQVENSTRLKKALNSKIPPPAMQHYNVGDEVFFKYAKNPHWQGPAKIIGLDNKVVFLRQGRFTLATSQTRVIKSSLI